MNHQGRLRALCRRIQTTLTEAVSISGEQVALHQIECELADNPDDGILHEAVGMALAAADLTDRAVSILETAQVLLPLVPAAELALAECYLAAGAPCHALTLLGNVGMRLDSDCDQRLRAARNLVQIGGCKAAWTICRRAVQDFPEEAAAWFELSHCMKRVGCPFWQIETAGLRAINLAPQVVRYRVALATTLHERDRSDDAWLLVQRFGAGQIAEVACQCCVERLQLIFEDARDRERADLCRDHHLDRLRQSSFSIENGNSEFTTGDSA